MSDARASGPERAADANPDWTLVDPDVVAAHVGVEIATGLSHDEAAARLAEHGPNELDSEPPEPGWRRLLRQFADPLIHLLLGAVVISLVAWGFEGAAGIPTDAVVIVAIIIANAIIGHVQEGRAADAVAALQRMSEVTSTVIRDGHAHRVAADQVVPGDVVTLAEGDSVPADARLVTTSSLQVAEASLTGESQPVTKASATLVAPASLGDRTNMVFKGTAVTQGVGTAVVTATGMDTEMGHVARLLNETEPERTPLEQEIAAVGKVLGIAVIIIACVVVAAMVLAGGVHTVPGFVDVLLVGVSLAVAAVPEGLPAILSVVLSVGVQAMSRRNAIIKALSSVETLGSASVICSDKTGTLTRNEMTMVTVRSVSGVTNVTGTGYAPTGQVLLDGTPLLERDPEFDLREEDIVILSGGTLASNAEVRQEEDGSWTVVGDPTEAAFVVAEQKAGLTESREQRFTRIAEVPFTSARKMMSVVVEDGHHTDASGQPQRTLVSKGAPDVLLQRCTRLRQGERVTELTETDRQHAAADVESMSSQALRTLAVAYRPLREGEYDTALDGDGTFDGDAGRSLENDLIFVGTVGIIDPPRAEAVTAVAEAHRAGVRVVMITGDHPTTAVRIAGELGIVDASAAALSGPQIDELTDEELRDAVRDVSVFARVAPEHKLRIIAALQDDGHIVAMTGDGVNDAPALRKANIGVAMGITGTEVSKQAADMILADDNFATIVAAIRQGRDIFQNIRKFLRYLLSSNMGEVLTMFLGVVLAGFLGLTGHGEAAVAPLLATQILWINLVTDSGPALAMGVDPESEDVMDQPPRSMQDRVINGRMWSTIVFVGLMMAAVTLFALDACLPGGLVEGSESVETARTAAFTTLVLAQLFNALNSRSDSRSAFHMMFANRWLWGAMAFAVVAQVAVVEVSFLQAAFGTEPLSPGQWMMCLGLASCVLWAEEVRKIVVRRAQRSGG